MKKAAEEAQARKKAIPVVKPGAAFGSRVVPDQKKKYELPAKAKPKVVEEAKGKRQPSKIATISKEPVYEKKKDPGIPSHKVVKQPPKPATDADGNPIPDKKLPAKGNAVVHVGNGSKGSIHAFDPMAAIKAAKHPADIKKIKAAQTKLSLVNQFEKMGIMPGQEEKKRTRPQSGVAKKKKAGGTQYKMPAKNRAYDNADIAGTFEEDDLMGGDQGAPPGGDDDEFGADELLGGDQGGNFDNDEDFELEDEAGSDDDFLNEDVTKPAAKK